MYLHPLSFGKSKVTLHDCALWFCFKKCMGISFIHLFLKIRIWIMIGIDLILFEIFILLSLINQSSLCWQELGFVEKRNQNWAGRLTLSSLFTWNTRQIWLELEIVCALSLWYTFGFDFCCLLLLTVIVILNSPMAMSPWGIELWRPLSRPLCLVCLLEMLPSLPCLFKVVCLRCSVCYM